MAGPILKTCCLCQSLRTGSVLSGVVGILLAVASLIVMFTARVEFRTIFFDFFPSWVVKIILAINLCMTIFISLLLIVGVFKVNFERSKRQFKSNCVVQFKTYSGTIIWCCHGLSWESHWLLGYWSLSFILLWCSLLTRLCWLVFYG